MHFGVSYWPTDYGIDIIDLGRAVEDRGLESLFFPEHTHIPASRRSPFPSGGELPRQYYHGMDPFVALGAVAAVTERLRLGTGICLVIERDTITLAKEVASLDHLSGGRFIFGIGGGWTLEEMENHGTDPKTRWKRLREQVLAMKQIWTQDEAEYHGEFVNFDPIWQWPKPAQQPYPPVLYGGAGPRALRRVAEYCEGWLPIAGRDTEPMEEKIAELNQLAGEFGRGPLSVTVSQTPLDPQAIERYAEAGVERCTFRLPAAGAEEVMPALDQIAEVVKSFR